MGKGYSVSQLKFLTEELANGVKIEQLRKARLEKRKEDVIRIVEAQIAGAVDLSPEEMVDAAFLIVERIDDKLYGKK